MDPALTAPELLGKLYYRPGGYAGPRALQAALQQEGIKADLPAIRQWVQTQELGQLTATRAKPEQRGRFDMQGAKLNDLHQADVLFLYQDPQGYKYCLCVIDCATRWKAAVPLKSKSAEAVAKAFEQAYDGASPLQWPKQLMVDDGSEFKGVCGRLLEAMGTKVRRSEAGYHRAQAFVESFNKQLGIRIYRALQARELLTGQPDYSWAKDLPALVDAMNHEPTRLLKTTPAAAVAQGGAPEIKPTKQQLLRQAQNRQQPVLPPSSQVRVRIASDRPDEGGQRLRATDWKWSKQVYSISKVVLDPEGRSPPLYYVEGRPHGFARADLLVVPKPQPPPHSILPPALADQYEVEKLVGRRTNGRRVEFLVKWKGYSDADNTWEPRAKLVKEIPELVQEYEARQ